MGILDGIVEWVSEQVMNALDLITTSVLGTLGCDMNTFLRFFPAAETMYSIFVATAVWADCRGRSRGSGEIKHPIGVVYRPHLLLR